MRKTAYILLQCTWGLPQTLIGAVIYLFHLRSRQPMYHGAAVSLWKRRYSASIGMFLFLSEHDADSRPLLVHEYGHTLQSLLLGPLYLPVIALPSMLWMLLPPCRKLRREKQISYYSFYTERWANCWAERICGEPAEGSRRENKG